MERWFATLWEVNVNARRMWLVRGVTAVHQDLTDLDRRAVVVSKTKREVEKKRGVDAMEGSANWKETQCFGKMNLYKETALVNTPIF